VILHTHRAARCGSFGRLERRGGDATRPETDNYTLRMTSTTTTMSKIKKTRPPPIYMTPPRMIRPRVHTRGYLYPSAWARRITRQSDASATVDATRSIHVAARRARTATDAFQVEVMPNLVAATAADQT